MIRFRNLRMIYKIMLPVAGVLILALGLLTWQIQDRTSTGIQRIAERELTAIAAEYGNQILAFFNVPLSEARSLADAMAYALSQGAAVPRESQLAMLRGTQLGNDVFLGVGVAWEPNALDNDDVAHAGRPGSDAAGRFIPYAAAGEDIEPLKDFESSDYYAIPKQQGRANITNPFIYPIAGKDVLLTTASVPMIVKGRFVGATMVDLSLETVSKLVADIRVYHSGAAVLINQSGEVLAHRDDRLVGQTLFSTGYVADEAALRAALRQESFFMETHIKDGVENFYCYYPVRFSFTGQTWFIGVSVPVDEVLADVKEISMVTGILSLITLILCMAVIFLVVRTCVKPVSHLVTAAQEIATGNLHVSIHDEQFGGEMLDLSTSLKDMIRSLIANIDKAEAMSTDAVLQSKKAREAMLEAEEARKAAENAKREGMLAAAEQLSDVVGLVSFASHQLSSQVEQSGQGAQLQAARVSETASAMEEMNATVLAVARSASHASDVSVTMKAKAEQGAGIVSEAVDGIRQVRDVSMALKDDMGRLSDQAHSISQIMAVITDIADQTNLLALNAAIEAARAGDAGRGFAVVADEVRKLAEKTMVSTKDVGGAIQSIQKSVDNSVTRMDRAVGLVEKATELSAMSGEALQEIVGLVDNTADQVRSIATASEQQSATSDEINRAISMINSIASESAQSMRDAGKAVEDLAAQAQSLSRLIDKMKTD